MFQNPMQVRDTANLCKDDLLSDYSRISSRRNLGAESTALRNNWPAFRDILAHQVTSGLYDYAELEQRVLAGLLEKSEVVSPEALGSLGVISVISRGGMVDLDFGLAALQKSIELLPKNRKSYRFRKLLVEYYLERRSLPLAQEMLELYPDIDREFYRYLRLDTLNPFIFPETGIFSDWLLAFNEPFVENQLAPLMLQPDIYPPFIGLTSDISTTNSETKTGLTPLVSVVMTASKAQDELLLSATKSVLAQTWKHIELLLVFDEEEDLSHKIRQLFENDNRVSTIPISTSRGLYADLNEGITRARGDFITFQSVTDWSHPERIEHQVTALRSSKQEVAACIAQGISSTLDLERSVLGYQPISFNPHSLMLTRKGMDAAGGYLPVTSGGATELCERLDKLSGTGTIKLPLPVTLSLTNAEEDCGRNSSFEWGHSSHRMFESSYRHWHKYATIPELCLSEHSHPKVMIPSYLSQQQPNESLTLDIVLAGDWTRFGGPQKSMLEEINALLKHGFTVGIMSLEAGRFMENIPRPLCEAVQELINNGQVTQVFPDEQLSANLLVLRYPPILQFIEPKPMSINAKRAIILANQAPSELDGSDIRYRIEDCNRNATIFFNCPYMWAPQGPQVRDALLQSGLSPDLLAEFDIPGIIDPEAWYVNRTTFRGNIPVVGRHSRDNNMKWPDNASDIKKLYPVDGKLDVRIMGGSKAPLKVLGYAQMPPGWIVHEVDEMPVSTFLSGLDFFVFYQHPSAVEAFGRAVLEAIAAGVVVILPPHFERVFGSSAVYSEIDDVLPTVRRFYNDWDLYKAQVERARAIVDAKFSYEVYSALVKELTEVECVQENA